MCGIAGFLGPPDAGVLSDMLDRIEHRGPDDHGTYEHPAASLGHRRLSIIDLDHGHQPVATADDRLHLVYNGEVYNFRELRAELEDDGVAFETNCDTEVVLQAYARWGTDCFARFNGMWALAFLDLRGERPELVLARDHYGIKPLYVTGVGGTDRTARTLFASEIKALLASPDLTPRPYRQWFYDYLLHGLHDHRPETSFEGVRQVLPATWERHHDDGTVETGTYWRPDTATTSADDPARFRELWTRSVERRLIADVPVGTCLSGGIDSSSIVCTSAELLARHVPDASSLGDTLRTFSVVYPGDPIDEREYIDAVLADVAAKPAFTTPDAKAWIGEVDRMVWHQDEPIVSSAPYAQWCVMRLAQPDVTVLLNGQAGDELLAGYVPYQLVYLRELRRRGELGELRREALASRDVLAPLARRKLAARRKALPVRPLLRDEFVADLQPPAHQRHQDDLKPRLVDDLTTFSLPSLLRYEDRNSMAHSMESRLPFLDQELVDWVLSLPSGAIVQDGWSRSILRRGLKGLLTEKVRTRRWKVGFTTPETRWLRSQRAAIQGLFRSPAFAGRPWWRAEEVAERFGRFCDGDLESSPLFWRAMNTELWHRVFFAPDGTSRRGLPPEQSICEAGDRAAVELVGTPGAAELLKVCAPHPDRHLFQWSTVDHHVYGRVPVRTQLFERGDDLTAGLLDALDALPAAAHLRDGDIVAISEKAVAICQGRSYPVADLHPSPLARRLAGFVKKTPAGIGLGIPETMELAIREVGAPRIVLAAAAAAAGKVVGRKGDFYRVAGPVVRAIDGPTRGTIPPYDTHAKLGPDRPDQVATGLARAFGARAEGGAGGTVRVAIIDANDRGVNVLGLSPGLGEDLVESLFRDNPLGQGSQQTPVALIRPVGTC